jgi:hypothetical protein
MPEPNIRIAGPTAVPAAMIAGRHRDSSNDRDRILFDPGARQLSVISDPDTPQAV